MRLFAYPQTSRSHCSFTFSLFCNPLLIWIVIIYWIVNVHRIISLKTGKTTQDPWLIEVNTRRKSEVRSSCAVVNGSMNKGNLSQKSFQEHTRNVCDCHAHSSGLYITVNDVSGNKKKQVSRSGQEDELYRRLHCISGAVRTVMNSRCTREAVAKTHAYMDVPLKIMHPIECIQKKIGCCSDRPG